MPSSVTQLRACGHFPFAPLLSLCLGISNVRSSALVQIPATPSRLARDLNLRQLSLLTEILRIVTGYIL